MPGLDFLKKGILGKARKRNDKAGKKVLDEIRASRSGTPRRREKARGSSR